MPKKLPKEGGLASLGVVPDDWEVLTFKDVSELRQGLQIPISSRYKDYKPERYVYITVEYLNNLNNPNLLEYIASPSERVICENEDVLVTRTGATGKIITGVRGVFHNNFFLAEYDRKEINRDYLVHFLKFEPVQKELRLRAGTTTIPDLNHGDFYSLTFIKPCLTEQEKIAKILNSCDEAIAHTSAFIAKLKQMKAGLLHDLLTRGLDENGELRDAIAHAEQFKPSPLGQIPKDWDARTLREILTGIDAGKSPSCPDMPAAGGEWGVLKVSAVHPSGFKPEENKVITNPVFINPAYEVKHHDLLITRSNTYDLVGLTCLVQNPPLQLLISDKTLRLNVNPQLVSIEFLAHVMQMPNIRLQIQTNATGSSAGMKNISQEEIKGFCVALPGKVDEQNRIVEVLNSYSNRIHFEEIYLGKLKAQKKGLMNNLLTGVVRVI